MMIVSKAAAMKSIRKVEYTVRGKVYTKHVIYFGTDGHGGKVREARSTREAAVDRVNEFYRLHRKNAGEGMAILKPAEIHDAKESLEILRRAGVTQTLTDTVRQWLDGKAAASGGVAVEGRSLGDAYEEYYAAFPAIQVLHRKSVRFRVRPWVMEFGASRMVSEITARELAAYLEPFRKTLKTYNNKLSYIKTFLAWCAKDERKYCRDNPAVGMKAAKIPYKEPEFMHADDFETFIRTIEARDDAKLIVPYIVLSYLCGVRREEITRLMAHPEKCVLLDGDSVRVGEPKGYTQGRPPRMFKMPPNAVAWMEWAWKGGKLGKSVKQINWIMDDVAKKLHITLPRNGGRHTFITMHVAAFRNPDLTQHIVDTSKKMRTNNYQGLVAQSEGEKFFSIMPLVKEVGQQGTSV